MPRPKKIEREEYQKIVDLYISGKKQTEIAINYRVSKERIRLICVEMLGKKFFERKHIKAKKEREKKEELKKLKRQRRKDVASGKAFSIKYDKCIKCGKGAGEVKYRGLGKCSNCYLKYRYKKFAYVRASKRKSIMKWQRNNPEKVRIIVNRAVRRYLDKIYADPILHEKLKTKQRKAYAKRQKNKA